MFRVKCELLLYMYMESFFVKMVTELLQLIQRFDRSYCQK